MVVEFSQSISSLPHSVLCGPNGSFYTGYIFADGQFSSLLKIVPTLRHLPQSYSNLRQYTECLLRPTESFIMGTVNPKGCCGEKENLEAESTEDNELRRVELSNVFMLGWIVGVYDGRRSAFNVCRPSGEMNFLLIYNEINPLLEQPLVSLTQYGGQECLSIGSHCKAL